MDKNYRCNRCLAKYREPFETSHLHHLIERWKNITQTATNLITKFLFGHCKNIYALEIHLLITQRTRLLILNSFKKRHIKTFNFFFCYKKNNKC